MTPGLTLTGRLDLSGAKLTKADARDWLARAAVWFEAVGDAVLAADVERDADDKPVLEIACHPAAPDAEIRVSASGVVRASAVTGPAGPGYHAHLCGLLTAFADEFEFVWEQADDPTGFAVAGDVAALAKAFRDGLRRKAHALLSTLREWAGEPVPLGLPADHGFTHPGPVLTPLGPRSAEWLAAVAADRLGGADVFPWREPALDAVFYRDRALTLLWCEYPWRPPLTADEGELADQIAADLATAHQLDPVLPLPWREWAEVAAHLDADAGQFTVEPVSAELRAEVARRAAETPPADPPIGYRRGPVRVPLADGWSVQVPGGFAEGWAADGKTWCGWDAARKVTATVGGVSEPAGPHFVEACDPCGRRVWQLTGAAAGPGPGVAYKIVVPDPAERAWAEAVCQSLRFAAA
ncbi:MAG: hypothetical protein U0871_27955 [Gemmataceae bacterium]